LRDKVIIIGAILVLGAGFALWRMTKDISSVDAEPPRAKTSAPASAEATDDAAPAPAPSAKRDARIAPAAVTPRSPTHPSGGGTAPSLEVGSGSASPPVSHARAIEVEIKHQLVRQIDGLESAITDCMAKASRTGAKPTGASAVTLRIERVKDQAAVVEVAVEPIDTTIKDVALNNCFRDTGKKIQLELPDGVTEVTATHQVNLDAGSITGHDLTAFEFKPWGRPVDPPPAPAPK
jgi:hypothetical protein